MPSLLLRWSLVVVAVCAVTRLAPVAICRMGADRLREDDRATQLALARGVGHWVSTGQLGAEAFTTGSDLFDGEWVFGTYMMAAMGFGQVAAQRPDGDPVRGEMLRHMDTCLARMAEPGPSAFDTRSWGRSALSDLDGDAGHAAYLGYYGLALALRSRIGPHPLDGRADAIAATLNRRLSSQPILETYPGERYPVDNVAGVAMVALVADARGRPRPPVVARWLDTMTARWLDPDSGLLIQSVDERGARLDGPRGSGTALASYFLSFVDDERARALYRAAEAALGDHVLGFGALREYPAGQAGSGDIDSGPLIAGFSISATGFSLAGAKRYGEAERFASLWATARLFGLPRRRDGALHFAAGGPIGDAILFAMLTAPSTGGKP